MRLWPIPLAAAYAALWAWRILPDDRFLLHDNFRFHYPFFHVLASSLREFGEIPSWNWTAGMGSPVFPWLHNFYAFLPSRAPVLALAWAGVGESSLWLYKLGLLLTQGMFAWFHWCLLREIVPGAWGRALGLALALFSGLATMTLFQEQATASLFFAPVLTLLAVRYHRDGRFRDAALGGTFLGLALCVHYPQLVLYWAAAAAAAAIVTLGPRAHGRRWARGALIALPFAGLAALPLVYNVVFTLPDLKSPSRTTGVGLAEDAAYIRETRSFNSLNAHHAAALVTPSTHRAYAHEPRDPANGFADDRVPFYLGWLALPLALFALIRGRRDPARRYWAVAAILTAAFAIGGYGFLYGWLYEYVPWARYQRIPLQMAYYLLWQIAILAALGFDDLRARFGARAAAAVGLLFAVDLGIYGARALDHLVPRAMTLARFRSWELPWQKPFVACQQAPACPEAGETMRRLNRFFWFAQAYDQGRREGWLHQHRPTATLPGAGTLAVAGGPLTVLRTRATYASAGLDVESPAGVVLTWRQYPGPHWRYRLDGQPLPVERDGIFLKATVPAGRHSVDWRYEPPAERALFGSAFVVMALALAIFAGSLKTAVTSRVKGLLPAFDATGY